MVALLAVSAFLRAFRLDEVAGQLIGDECWYVQDARVLLGLPLANMKNLPAHPLSGLDPNSEHPPLPKLIMAGFMKVFGEKEIAWRIPSVILGTLCIWLLYLTVRRLGGSKRLAFTSAFILAFDNLSFIQGRIAMLDVYLTAFLMLGLWLYLARRYELAGMAFGLASLCKINGVLGLGVMFLFEAFMGLRRNWQGSLRKSWPALRPTWASLAPLASATAFCVAFFLTGLGTLDNYWTEFKGPFEHLAHMVSYHTGLTHHGAPTGNESTPFQWLTNEGAFNYFTWTWTVNNKVQNVAFKAAMNPYVIFAAPLALFYAGQRAWSERSAVGAFALASFIPLFGFPFLSWAVLSRTSYIFYMMPTIPAFACAIALAVENLPRSVRWFGGLVLLYGFFYAFPFRYFE